LRSRPDLFGYTTGRVRRQLTEVVPITSTVSAPSGRLLRAQYLVLATEPKLSTSKWRVRTSQAFPYGDLSLRRDSSLPSEGSIEALRWDVILVRTPATRRHANGARDWDNLRKLAANAARRVAEQIGARTQSMLLMYPGLLGRYGQLSILDELADSLGAHSLWVLAGSEHQKASPLVDGQAIPARPTQWAWIPAKWLDNEFRKIKADQRRDP